MAGHNVAYGQGLADGDLVRLVTWLAGGQAWTRCEEHAPESVRAVLDAPPAPLVEVEWMPVADRRRRCYGCLVGADAGWTQRNVWRGP